MNKLLQILFALVGLLVACTSSVRAGVIIYANEIGGNVVFAGGGTANLTGLTKVQAAGAVTAYIEPVA